MFVKIYYGKSETATQGIAIMDGSMLHIGVSGHQQIGDEAAIEFVSQQIHELLSKFLRLRREHGQNVIAYSALAIGTDRLFVKAALELGIPVEVVIPCSQYADIYDSAEIREEYHDLLSRCQQVHELPFPFAISKKRKVRYNQHECVWL